MRYPTFAAYKFNETNYPFDVREYSRFKYGSLSAARNIAKELYLKYIKDLPYIDKEIVVFPSPYHFIPSACSLIKEYFLIFLNRHLVEIGKLPANEACIHRRLSYHTDYGKKTAEEREELISNDKFYIDREYIKDKFCIFLDDVRITGSHEREVEKLLDGTDIDYQVVYYAQYEGDNCLIEDYLNTNFIKSIYGILTIIDNNDFVFNVRNIRMILTLPDFKEFLKIVSHEFKVELYDQCIGNHYHLVDIYIRKI